MNIIRILLISMMAISCINPIYSRQYFETSSKHLFYSISTTNGLSCNNVQCILKDSHGFMWFGTEYGLNRYNGYQFKTFFRKEIPNSTDNIKTILEDKQGNIWIDMGDITVYDWRTDSFIDGKEKLKLLGINCNEFKHLFSDSEKRIWMAIDNFLIMIRDDGTISKYILPFQSNINSLSGKGTHMYLTTSDSLYELDIVSGLFSKEQLPPDIISFFDSNVFIYNDENNDLWLYSTEKKILWRKQNYSNEYKKVILPIDNENCMIRDIIDDEKGHIWIATDKEGIFILEKKSGKFHNEKNDRSNPFSICSNNISHLYRDTDNNIWISHYRAGVSYLVNNSSNITKHDLQLNGSVACILEDSNFQLWLGTDGEGLICKNRNGQYESVNIPAKSITSLYEDTQKRIWIGTYLKGLFCYDKGHIKQFTSENSNLPNNNIWTIKEDRFNRLWLGSIQKGICCFDTKKQSFTPFFQDYYIGCCLQMYYDNKDSLFAATNAGIGILNVTTLKDTIFTSNKSGTIKFKHQFVRTIYKDSRNWLWMGFAGELGIWDLNTDSISFINQKDGLCNNLINGIIEDKNHNMWISTANGISNIIINEANISNQNYIKQIFNYTTDDGLLCNDMNGVELINNGDILIASNNGYTSISPINIAPQIKVLEPIISDIFVNGQSLSYTQWRQSSGKYMLSISPTLWLKDYVINLYISTLDFKHLHKQMYAYKFEGKNGDWITTNNNNIQLTQLGYGKHTIKIKAYGPKGLWEDGYTFIEIKITPPFWMSNIAYIIYTILLAVFLFIFFKRIQKKREQKMVLKEQQLYTERQIELYNMKMNFLTNISHDIRTPLSLIVSPLENLLKETKRNENLHNKINVAYRNALYLLSLVNRLLEFRRLDAHVEKLNLISGNIISFIEDIYLSFKTYTDENQKNLIFNTNISSLNMSFDKEKINRIIYNLLSNAAKFTNRNGNIWINIWREDNILFICIADDGIGIPQKNIEQIFNPFFQIRQNDVNNGTGIGLYITKEYIKLHNGNIKVEPNCPKGTKFTIQLPIIIEETTAITNNYINNIDSNNNADTDLKPTLLLVEDNIEFINFLADSLCSQFNIIKAENGKSALKILNEKEPDIIISDVMMPEIDGLKLCNIIKTNLKWSHIPVILLTARTAEEHKMEGLKNGADDYITKPFSMDLLVLRIQKFLDWKIKCQKDFIRKTNISPEEITISTIDKEFIEKANRIIEKNIDNAYYSVEDFSHDMNISRANLYRKMMAIVGKSPIEYIRITRLKKAKQMLVAGVRISEIAYSVGFNQPKYFTKYFKEEFGVTPKEFIKNIK